MGRTPHIISKVFISATDKISSILLDNPYLFNHVRYLLAGKQTKMKKFIKKYLKDYKCKTIADVCSGTGDFAELTSKQTVYVGWDINEDFIQFAKKRYKGHKNKQFIKMDVLDKKFTPHRRYDAILLISTIHHFSDQDLEILLPNIKKSVKKVVIIADIIPDPPHLIQKFFAKIDRGKYVRPAQEKLQILKKYFTVVHVEEIPTRSAVQFGIICIPK